MHDIPPSPTMELKILEFNSDVCHFSVFWLLGRKAQPAGLSKTQVEWRGMTHDLIQGQSGVFKKAGREGKRKEKGLDSNSVFQVAGIKSILSPPFYCSTLSCICILVSRSLLGPTWLILAGTANAGSCIEGMCALSASNCSKVYLSPSSLTGHPCVMCIPTSMEPNLCFNGLFQRKLLFFFLF